MAGFADLIVWQEAARLAVAVQQATESLRGPGARAAADQLVRAANSIAANIAEGYGRGVTLDCIRFFKIAKSSADEVESHLRLTALCRRLPTETVDPLISHVRRVGFLIYRFQESVERRRKKQR